MKCPQCSVEMPDDSTHCPQCTDSSDPPVKPVCFLARLSLWCFLFAFLLVFAVMIFASFMTEPNMYIIGGGIIILFSVITLFLISPVLAIAALLRIYRSNNMFQGKGRAITVIVLSSLPILMMSPIMGVNLNGWGARIQCANNMRALSDALYHYVDKHNGMLPDLDTWCDTLIIEADVLPEQFICRADQGIWYGQSSYAMNENVAGMPLSDLPPEMVVLFEVRHMEEDSAPNFPVTSRRFAAHVKGGQFECNKSEKVYERRWNQSGGPESLAVNHRYMLGCYVMLANGDVQFVIQSRMPELRWSLDTGASSTAYLFSIDQRRLVIRWLCVILGALLASAVAGMAYRFCLKTPVFLPLLLSVISAVVGCFLGFAAEHFYWVYDDAGIGMVVGGFVGFILGSFYIAFFMRHPDSVRQQDGFRGYVTSVGMLAGIISSILVHVILALMYGGMKFAPTVVLSIPVGILSGSISGAIIGGLMKKTLPPPAKKASESPYWEKPSV